MYLPPCIQFIIKSWILTLSRAKAWRNDVALSTQPRPNLPKNTPVLSHQSDGLFRIFTPNPLVGFSPLHDYSCPGMPGKAQYFQPHLCAFRLQFALYLDERLPSYSSHLLARYLERIIYCHSPKRRFSENNNHPFLRHCSSSSYRQSPTNL